MPAKEVLLRNLDNQKTQSFDPEHAERLLKFPGTRWGQVDEQAAEEPATAKKKKGAGEPDATGHATEA